MSNLDENNIPEREPERAPELEPAREPGPDHVREVKPVSISEREDRWDERRRWRGSIFFPIVLITLGVLFLLSNIGIITGNLWDVIVDLWPVLLIAIGLDSLVKREGFIGPVFWIGLGTAFLLSTLDVVDWNVWAVVLRLWPILLVAIGLDLVLGRRSIWANILGLLLLVGIIAGAVWLLDVVAVEQETVSIAQPVEDAEQARIDLEPAIGSLQVNAIEGDGDNLVEGGVGHQSGEGIIQDYSVENGTGQFTLANEGFNAGFAMDADWEWNLNFNGNIPLEFIVDMGVGSIDMDLSDLMVSDVDIDLGIGRTIVILPAAGDLEGRINGAIGQTTIIVPEGAGVRLQSDTGIAVLDVPDDYVQDDEVYLSPGYAEAENQIDLAVGQAIGVLLIREE